jgi:hypothetical protein
MAEQTKWADLAIDLYDRLTGRNAEITYELEDMDIWVPDSTGDDPTSAHWKLNGTLRIRTRDLPEG